MQNLKLAHTLLLCLAILIAGEKVISQANASFIFTLNGNANTSAGVFAQDGTLIKTLWSGVPYNAGTYKQYWDGTDNEGMLVTGGSYTVRVLSNNIKYTWEGVIGNTSTAQSGQTVHHAFQGIYGMAFSGTRAYLALNYNEQLPPIAYINTSAPQAKTFMLTKGCATAFVATDGNYVYYDGMDPNDLPKTFVYATKVSDNSEVTSFSNGSSVPILYSRTYANAIDIAYDANSKVSGMAVQKKGRYLFVSHQNNNQVHVLDKTTGQLIQIMYIYTPGGLAIDPNDALWVISGNSVLKYNINADGTFSSLMASLNGLISPMALAVSPDGNTVIVADGGNSQQIKAYGNYTGSPLWAYGQAGGYNNSPDVSNNKFYFADHDQVHTYINFAADGTFWVGDPGNCRVMHFTAACAFIENIMYLPHFYSTAADPNNPTRVFADYLEFKIDYSKSLSPSNGSWTLVKNWGYNITKDYDDQFYRFRYLTTLSNGHTYAFIRHIYNLALVELPATGGIRYTGVEMQDMDYQLFADGSLKKATQIVMGQPTTWTTRALNGFDGSNNPVWGSPTVIATSPPATDKDPLYYGSGNSVVTSSNVIVSFDAGLSPVGSTGYHLGGIKAGSGKWLWRTANSTFKQYSGAYPADGAYDIGNNVKYAGSFARALDRTIIWGYHGEFWKNAETNEWTQVYDDGLFLGQFGVAGPDYTYAEAAPMFAGNAMSVSVVKGADGNGYVYINDEASHGGLHIWKITGLNTIAEQTVPIVTTALPHGLMSEYFAGADLNTSNSKTKRVEPTVNLVNGFQGILGVAAGQNVSVRWTGFVNPLYTDLYTFYANTSSGVRLWVNDSLLINQWSSNRTTEYNANIALAAGQQYSIRMEYHSYNNPYDIMSWSSAHQPKQVIPTQNLYPANFTDTVGGIDLLQGLSFTSTLVDNMYGWKRYPATEDFSDFYAKWWSVTTGYNSYDRLKSPDVTIKFSQNTGNYSVTRDLGANNNLTAWNLNGVVDYNGNFENDINGNGGGMSIDVLDDKGYYIARFFPTADYNKPYSRIAILANYKTVVLDTTAKVISAMSVPQSLSISVTNGIYTIKYANYPTITTSIPVAGGNWKNPKTIRFNFIGNFNNYDHSIVIKKLRFSSKANNSLLATSPTDSAIVSNLQVSKLPALIVYPNPVKDVLHINYPTVSGDGSLQIISADGRTLQNIQLENTSTQTAANVSMLPAGAYFVVFKTNKIQMSASFVK